VVRFPGIQRNEYGNVPPVGFAFAVPLHTPEQLAFTEVTLLAMASGSVIVTVAVPEQLFASVTVTVYVLHIDC
jgi:hypothetical protein